MIDFLKKLFSNRNAEQQARSELFKNNTYLAYPQKPEGVVVVPVRNIIHDAQNPEKLLEDNAETLKKLSRDYNVKIIALTAYNSPDKSNRSKTNRLLVSAGISEIYYSDNKFVVTESDMIKGKPPSPVNYKLAASHDIQTRYGIEASKMFMLDNEYSINELFEEEGYTLVSSIDDLQYVVSQNIAKRKLN